MPRIVILIFHKRVMKNRPSQKESDVPYPHATLRHEPFRRVVLTNELTWEKNLRLSTEITPENIKEIREVVGQNPVLPVRTIEQ